MNQPASTPAAIGVIVRTERKRQGLRQEELALAAGTGPRFIVDLEAGKPTVRLNAVLQVIAALGLKLSVDIPEPRDAGA